LEVKWFPLKLLVTGASGLFGSKLAETAFAAKLDVYSGFSRDSVLFGFPVKFDVSDKNQVDSAFATVKPDFVVHAASLTDVDKCERDHSLAWKINVEGTKNVAEATARHGAFLVYISSDYVFGGEKGCYRENDTPDPINYYGLTKLRAEETAKKLVPYCCIARASVIYGASPAAGKVNFALWLLNKLRNGEKARIVTDQWNSPTLNTNLADMVLEVVNRRLSGVFHLCGASRVSRYELALQIAETFGLEAELIERVDSSTLRLLARRPKDSSLDVSKATKLLKNKPLQLVDSLALLKQELTLK